MAGRVTVVGLGPGDAGLLPPLARAALERAACIVGYTAYVELVDQEILAARRVVSTGMMGEVERCGAALDLALAGDEVAVVCSGDPGVYAMAGLVLELAEARGLVGSLDIEVVPGIPAVCAAASLLGAPLMHDFAVVSLSDLLTPWEVIERRLDAAAGADFVIAVYNPRSRRRADHLGRALAVIARHRGPATPVGLVKNAFRPEQEALVTTLAGLDPGQVDMLSVLIVGNSATRTLDAKSGPRMLTPRGYAGKYALGDGTAGGS